MESGPASWTFIGLLLALLATATAVALGGGAALAAPEVDTELAAKLTGDAVDGDPDGRGTARLDLRRSKRKLCYEVAAQDIEKGRVFVGEGAKGEQGTRVLTLFSRRYERRGLKGCVQNVPAKLLDGMEAHPKRFFVEFANREYPKGAIRGWLRESSGGPQGTYSATDCYIYLDDDTGEGNDFATGQHTTPTPINGGGVRYLATEDHSVTTCIASRTYDLPNGTIKVYAKDRLIGSNVYSCTATGIYKCFGPREGSTTSGYTLSVIYYVCIPGAWPPAYYCPR